MGALGQLLCAVLCACALQYRVQAAEKGIPFVDLKNLSLLELQLYLLPVFRYAASCKAHMRMRLANHESRHLVWHKQLRTCTGLAATADTSSRVGKILVASAALLLDLACAWLHTL